ncbi:HD-GYP domain-containing protein [Xylophilus sp. ASV27]|uniref:HD-GYP domain-containing protein n=1 Tax=Xylophilus sp. ASV27 TaxID=2795129 RepID=UPI0018ECCF9B|nr:phosphohydrolase [Xylophilus sp. ASV27]
MNLVPLKPDTLRLGQPLPFSLRTATGTLLAARGMVLDSRSQLDQLLEGGASLYVDIDESPEYQRAFMGQLDRLLRTDQTIGQIASARVSADVPLSEPRARTEGAARAEKTDWHELQLRATALLRAPKAHDFMARLQRVHADLDAQARRQPDATLFTLVHFAARELNMYSATHGLLVAVVCTMAARDILRWDAPTCETLGRVALTMNIAMTELQDILALQPGRPQAAQMAAIAVHADASAALLERLGVFDPLWLEAVRLHHAPPTGALAQMTPAGRIARLVERADIFTARLSPRVSRKAMGAAMALRGSYYDQEQRVDEAGAALIAALGVYPPGCFVRLASNETAVVLRRGRNGTSPRVAVVLNRQGLPAGEPVVRDTSQSAFKIAAGVPHHEVKVKLPLDKMLALV